LLKHKRLVSIIAAIAFCLSFLAPAIIAPAPAVAAGSITALQVPVVKDGTTNAKLGTVKVVVPAGSVGSGDVIVFELPTDCTFPAAFDTTIYASDVAAPGVANYVDAPKKLGNDDNGFYDSSGNLILSIVKTTNRTVQIRVLDNKQMRPGCDGVFYVYLGSINIDRGVKGELKAILDGPAGTGFPLGTVVVARTSDDSDVELSTSSLQTSNNNFEFKLRIKENIVGALKARDESLVLILPDGYEWTDKGTPTTLWGNAFPGNIEIVANSEEELRFNVTSETSVASAWEVTLKFHVVDDRVVKEGDILAKVKGKSNATPSELKVGTFGEFGVKLTCEKPKEVYAGKIDQEIGEFTLKEIIPDTLIQDRYITLELPSYAKWEKIDSSVRDGNTVLEYAGVAGSNGNIIKYNIKEAVVRDSAAEIEFKDFRVALDVTAPGDLVVTVGGNAGVKAEVAVAKIALPVTMKAENTTEVKIGAANQKIGDLVITETVAGAIGDKISLPNLPLGNEIWVKVPAGCEWAKIPTITVESGDIKLDLANVRKAKYPGGDTSATTDYYQYIVIPVERDSNEPSVIKLTDCYVTVDRTVPEGSLTVGLLGQAVLQSNGAYKGEVIPLKQTTGYRVPATSGLFPQTAAIAGAAAATVVTPSQGGGVVSFYIGSQVYTVNGVQQFMDVAPYIKADRTYVPVRFLSEALGAKVDWDEATKTVTVTKGDKSVVLVIGSTIAKINGADVQMDVAPEISGVGRTMLPARWVAEGLGYQVGWIPTLKQVVIQ